MKTARKFLKRYWLFLLLSFFIGVFLSFKCLNQNSLINNDSFKKKISLPLIKYELINKIPLNGSFSVEIDSSGLVKTGKIYEIKQGFFSLEEISIIAKNLNFSSKPNILIDQRTKETIYSWKNDNYELSVNKNSREITYTNIKEKLMNNNYLKEGDLKNIALDFIINFSSSIPKDTTLNVIGFEKTKFENTEKEIEAYQIKLGFKIGDIDLITEKGNLFIKNNGEILDFKQNFPFKEINIKNEYPLINKQELENKIKNVKLISYFKDKDEIDLDINNVKYLKFNKVKLEYLKNNLSLQPVFLITGEASLVDGTQAETGLYLPAIKDQYLLK